MSIKCLLKICWLVDVDFACNISGSSCIIMIKVLSESSHTKNKYQDGY